MKDFLKENSKYKIVAKLSIISVTALLRVLKWIVQFYFTLYGLGKIAESLKKSGPYVNSVVMTGLGLQAEYMLCCLRNLHNNHTKRRGPLKRIP
jgi:hypothetical protein